MRGHRLATICYNPGTTINKNQSKINGILDDILRDRWSICDRNRMLGPAAIGGAPHFDITLLLEKKDQSTAGEYSQTRLAEESNLGVTATSTQKTYLDDLAGDNMKHV